MNELKIAGLKSTPIRIAVLDILNQTSKPLDVVQILTLLDKRGVNPDRVTVFRIMNTLLEKNLVKPIQFNDGKLRYEHISKSDHHHFVCEKCNTIEDISDCTIPKLEEELQKKRKILIKRHSLEFFGICTKCQ